MIAGMPQSHVFEMDQKIDARYRSFFWQRGYGVFLVSPSQLETVLQYIDVQQEHHRTRTFQEEHRELLRRHGSISTSGISGIETLNRAFSAALVDNRIPGAGAPG